jgi:Major intrinsic protein
MAGGGSSNVYAGPDDLGRRAIRALRNTLAGWIDDYRSLLVYLIHSFANPAVTIARGFTTTFSGIAINHVPGFIIAQLIGAMIGAVVSSALFAFGKSAHRTAIVAGEPEVAQTPQPQN